MKKRTSVDFSKHELTINSCECAVIHCLKIPGTITNSIKFINTSGILAVTGDFGDWIFCREFHPSSDGYVSDSYWTSKAKIGTCQDPYVFDYEFAKEEIKLLLEQHEFSDEEKEWLNDLSNEADQGEYSFIAKVMDHPSTFETEMIPDGKKFRQWLLIIFDGFEEICNRIKIAAQENKGAKKEI